MSYEDNEQFIVTENSSRRPSEIRSRTGSVDPHLGGDVKSGTSQRIGKESEEK